MSNVIEADPDSNLGMAQIRQKRWAVSGLDPANHIVITNKTFIVKFPILTSCFTHIKSNAK